MHTIHTLKNNVPFLEPIRNLLEEVMTVVNVFLDSGHVAFFTRE